MEIPNKQGSCVASPERDGKYGVLCKVSGVNGEDDRLRMGSSSSVPEPVQREGAAGPLPAVHRSAAEPCASRSG